MTILYAGLNVFLKRVLSLSCLPCISLNAVTIKKSFVSLAYYKNMSEKISKLLDLTILFF